MLLYRLLACIASDEKSAVILIFASSVCNVFYSSGYFYDFLFITVFKLLDYDVPWCSCMHVSFFFKFLKNIYLFIWLSLVLVAAHGIFRCSARALLPCTSFSLVWHAGLVASSCGMACGILVPRPGIEPESPALEGGFLTTGPPGKSLYVCFLCLGFVEHLVSVDL